MTERYAMQSEMDDEPIYIVDRDNLDEDGEPQTVLEVNRNGDPEGELALARRIVNAMNAGNEGNAKPAMLGDLLGGF